jgi:TPR repeat protein
MYDNGLGVPEDDAEAVKWYRKAAEQGNASAQYYLGFMYANGEGVPQDDAEAEKWHRKAAEQGFSFAQVGLGMMYLSGEGVPEDDVAAYAWFSVAAASGDDDGRENRDDIKDELTPSQIEKGEAMAREISERIEKRKAAKGE